MNFFRAQQKGHSFKQMKSHNSEDGGDGNAVGLCAVDSVSGLLQNTVWDAMNPDDEVVVFSGTIVTEIYDGYRVRPIAEIVRFSCAEFEAHAEEIAIEYEVW